MLGYYVFNSTKNLWLQDDEKSWGSFNTAQEFTSADLARDIAYRQGTRNAVLYVMAVLPS